MRSAGFSPLSFSASTLAPIDSRYLGWSRKAVRLLKGQSDGTQTLHSLLSQLQLIFRSRIDPLFWLQGLEMFGFWTSGSLIDCRTLKFNTHGPFHLSLDLPSLWTHCWIAYISFLVFSQIFSFRSFWPHRLYEPPPKNKENFENAELLGNLWVAVAAGHVKRRPAVFVPLMDIGAVLHQQLHHLQVAREHSFV